jgi:hypothetical protein
MCTLLVEQRCPTCGSGDLLELLHVSLVDAFELPVRPDDCRGEPGFLCVGCEAEFSPEPEPVR